MPLDSSDLAMLERIAIALERIGDYLKDIKQNDRSVS